MNTPIQAPYNVRRQATSEAKPMVTPFSTHRFVARLGALTERGLVFDNTGAADLKVAHFSLNDHKVALEARPVGGELVSITMVVDKSQCQREGEMPAVVGQLALEALGLDDLAI